MYKLLTKHGQLGALLLGLGAIAISLFSIIAGIKGAGYSTSDDLNVILKNTTDQTFDFFNPGVYMVALLLGAALLLWAIFAIRGLVSNPKGSMKFIIGFLILLGLLFALYSMAENETTGKISELLQRENVSETTSKFISAGVKGTVILGVLTAAAMVLFEIRNLFK